MDMKSFELRNRSYRLTVEGTLYVFTVSKDEWIEVVPKKITMSGKEYLRYALYDPQHDWAMDNSLALVSYDKKLDEYNRRRESLVTTGPVGWIITNSLRDITPPVMPIPTARWSWKRFYVSHGSIVLQYWYWAKVEWRFISYVDNVPSNRLHTANWICEDFKWFKNAGWRKKLPLWVINTILANCGSYSSEYIAKALDLWRATVSRVILGKFGYESLWDRDQYALNIRSSRGSFYGITCYPWELPFDFINRVMVAWSNDFQYQEYCSQWNKSGRASKGYMWYRDWEEKYGRDPRVSRELMCRWVQMNSEYIDNVEELIDYINGWVISGDRCWDLDKYNKYVKANAARMPKKVKVMEWVPCVLRNVWVQSVEKTFFDLSDWQLINLYDYCMWDFQSGSASASEMINYVEHFLEDEPDWNQYEANGYSSREELWESYESLLGGLSVRDFRTAHYDVLRSIPYTDAN